MAHPAIDLSLVALALLAVSALTVAPALGAAGDLDSSFSGDGVRRISFSTDDDVADDVLVLPDRRIVGIGRGDSDMTVARLRPGGSFDGTFSGDGRQRIDFGGNDAAFGVAVQGGKLVLAGHHDKRAALARLRADGKLDRGFSGDGRVAFLPTGCQSSFLNAVAAGPGGTVVAVGDCQDASSDQLGLVARFTARGRLDRTFSGDGIKTIVRTDDVVAVDVRVLADGRILVLLYGEEQDNAVLRLRPNGSLDSTYGGGDGKADLPDDWSPRAMARSGSGLVVVAGGLGSPGPTINVTRLRADGTRASGFGGGDGLVAITDSAIGATTVSDVAIGPGGRIVIGASNGNQQVIRLTKAGALDGSFGGGLGVVELGGAQLDGVGGVDVDGAGRIVVGGTLGLPGPGDTQDQVALGLLSE